MKIIKFSIIVTLMFLLVWGIANSTSVTNYITTLKYQQVISLIDWNTIINEYAKNHNEEPIEPKIDRIWKLIPGYNGLVIDRNATLNLIYKEKPTTSNQINYIWQEIEPKLKMTELGIYPIYRGNPAKPEVSFMINVAWGTEYLDSILSVLKKENVKATFFLDGSWLKKNPNIALKIANEGHEIGNHAYSHPLMSRLSDDRIKQEIIKTEELINTITHKSSKYFAPPAGDYNQRVVEIANELNMYTVLWTIDTVDWKNPTPETIIKRIVPKVGNGYLILMHPTKSTAEAMPILIKEIKKKGLRIGPVAETLSTKRILMVESAINF